jgi:hypothetical protein
VNLTFIYILLVLVFTSLMSIANAANAEKWFLMARHGECAEIKSLERKIPGIGSIEDPKSFALFMKNRGYKVNANEHKDFQGKAIQVNIPVKELGLIFVKGSLCKKFIDR